MPNFGSSCPTVQLLKCQKCGLENECDLLFWILVCVTEKSEI